MCLFLFYFFARLTDSPSRKGGRWETKHFIGLALSVHWEDLMEQIKKICQIHFKTSENQPFKSYIWRKHYKIQTQISRQRWKIHEGVEYFRPNRSQLEFLPATKNHQAGRLLGGLGDSEDESDVKIFSVPDSETFCNQLYTSSSNWYQDGHSKLKGTLIEFLTQTNLTETTSIMHMAIKVFNSIFTTAMHKGTIITLLDDSNLNAFQTFWPRLNILRLVGFP